MNGPATPPHPPDGVRVDDLPPADGLWWPWAVLAGTDASLGRHDNRLDRGSAVLVRTGARGWLRMQRLRGDRAVLWGRAHDDRRSEVRTRAPEWTLTEAVTADPGPVLAWFAHGEWDAPRDVLESWSGELLAPLVDPSVLVATLGALGAEIDLGLVPTVVAGAASGRLEAATFCDLLRGRDPARGIGVLRDAARVAERRPTDAVRDRLREQIHEQMRQSGEADRHVAQRPALLVRWARIADLGFPFEYAVMNERGRLLPARTNVPLPAPYGATLANLMQQLLLEETDQDSGAWLFARVSSDGVQVALDLCYDSWPAWFPGRGEGPTLAGLAWEMAQRTPAWRPAWASLLPRP